MLHLNLRPDNTQRCPCTSYVISIHTPLTLLPNHVYNPTHLSLLSLLIRILGLDSRQLKLCTHTTLHRPPPTQRLVHIPRKQTNPRLHIIMYLESYIVDIGNLPRRMGDLVLRSLILELKKAPTPRIALVYFSPLKNKKIKIANRRRENSRTD